MNKLIAVSILSGISAFCSGAMAQDFAQPGQVVVGAERLMGLYYDHVKTTSSVGAGEMTTGTTSIGLFGTPGSVDSTNPGTLNGGPMPSSTPRLALDVFVIPGLSVGTSLIYLNRSGSQDTKATVLGTTLTQTRDTPTTSSFILSPRVGYAAVLSPNFAIWPRAGITYSWYKTTAKDTNAAGATTENKISADITDISVEVMAAIVPVPHVVLLVGPVLDIPLGGGAKSVNAGTEATDHPSVSYLSVGLTTGLAAYF